MTVFRMTAGMNAKQKNGKGLRDFGIRGRNYIRSGRFDMTSLSVLLNRIIIKQKNVMTATC